MSTSLAMLIESDALKTSTDEKVKVNRTSVQCTAAESESLRYDVCYQETVQFYLPPTLSCKNGMNHMPAFSPQLLRVGG